MNRPSTYDQLLQLFSALADGSITPEQFQRLSDLLENDPLARRSYLQLTYMHGTLPELVLRRGEEAAQQVVQGVERPKETPPSPRRRYRVSRILVAAAAACLLGVACFLWLVPPVQEARLVAATGEVELVSEAGTLTLAKIGQALEAGVILETKGDDSSATIELADATRLTLGANSRVRLPRSAATQARDGKRITVLDGHLHAQVALRPNSLPWLVETPDALIRVPGNSLKVFVADAVPTRVELDEGEAEVVRLADQETWTVGAGSYAWVDSRDPPGVHPLPLLITEPVAGWKSAASKVVFAPAAGAFLAVGQRGGMLVTPSNGANKQAFRWERTDPPFAISRNVQVFAGTNDRIQQTIRHLSSGKTIVVKSPVEGGWVRACALSPTGARLVTALSQPRPESVLLLWDTATGELLGRQSVSGEAVALDWSPDERYLAVGVLKNPSLLLDGQTLATVMPLGPRVNDERLVLFSPDSRRLAIQYQKQGIRVWQGEPLAMARTFYVSSGEVTALAFSPDGKLLAGGTSAAEVRIWDLETGLERHVIRGRSRVLDISFSADGQLLATVEAQSSGPGEILVKVWELRPR